MHRQEDLPAGTAIFILFISALCVGMFILGRYTAKKDDRSDYFLVKKSVYKHAVAQNNSLIFYNGLSNEDKLADQKFIEGISQ